jgi:DNA-binding transcriptional ArsR family regulator
MSSSANIVEVAALIGDTARATMLAALMEGQQLTGSELAAIAHVSRSTASEHLKKLVEARLVCVSPQGRHCYYRIGSPLVARMLESIGAVAAIDVPPRFRPRSLRNEALVLVRTCYDHLAGTLAVALAEKLEAGGHIVMGEDGGEVTPGGLAHFERFGLALPRTRTGRFFCRPCLDWTERRHHLAGAVGVALACRCFELGWLRRQPASRVVAVTPAGIAGLRHWFDLDISALVPEKAAEFA